MVRKRTKKSFDGEVILLIHHNGINFGISVPHFLDHSPTMLPWGTSEGDEGRDAKKR